MEVDDCRDVEAYKVKERIICSRSAILDLS